MKIHEYQAKSILGRYGVPVPRGEVASSVKKALAIAEKLGGDTWVVKAQIHAGGRGKGGGVKVSRGREALEANAGAILGMRLITHQTGPKGRKGRKGLSEEGMETKRGLDLSMLIDRTTR